MKKHSFTLFEILIATGLLVVIAVIVLQIFMAASSLWRGVEEQNNLYADAKIALDLMGSELENALYANSDKDDSGCAPIWAEAVSLGSSNPFPDVYFSYGGKHAAALHFISRTTGADLKRDVCEVSYVFLPPRQDGKTWSDGTEEWSGSGALLRKSVNSSSSDYNFVDYPRKDLDGNGNIVDGDGERCRKIFTNGSEDYAKVIDGVLDFRVTAFQKDDWEKPYNLCDGSGSQFSNIALSKGIDQNLRDGLVNVKMIQLEITMLSPERIRELAAMSGDVDRQAAFIQQYARTFTKTVFLR